jgi:hypothetical protein
MTNGEHDRDGAGDVPADEQEDRPELDVETAFAAIVAGWTTEEAAGPGSWPAQEDLDLGDLPRPGADLASAPDADAAANPGQPDVGSRQLPASWEESFPGVEPSDTPGEAADGDEPGYVPPEPPPLPRGDLLFRLAWIGVIGGPLFLLLAALFWRDLPQSLLLLCLVAFVGGFVTLVARMPGDHRDDDDDGAVV